MKKGRARYAHISKYIYACWGQIYAVSFSCPDKNGKQICFFAFLYWQWVFGGGANAAHKRLSAKLRETFWTPLKCQKIEFNFDVDSQ